MIQKQNNKKQNKVVKTILYWGAINLGVFLLAFGVYMFEVPNNFAMGGVGGLSVILAHYLEPLVSWLNQPVILAILNVTLLLIGLIFLGKALTVKTLYCTLAYSGEVYLMGLIHPMVDPATGLPQPLTNQPLLELVYAVILVGSGSAILFQCRASSGGSDIIALIVKKYTGMQIGIAVLVSDFFIGFLAFISFSDNLAIGLLSVLGIAVKTFVIDGVIDNITKTKYVTIITVNPDIVAKVIIEDIDRGFTKYKAEGGFTGEERSIIITVCRRSQAARLKMKLHEVDPSAFVIVTNVNEILGKGFAEKM